ncbi:MAG: hypothetical protein KA974_05640 [Saprospiraceae bacterium]|nr:hypothetical protein [Saprospiraceae bacterium]MBP7699279.1 hypothetical protein [Saprospiraceae bacterium]
MRPTRAASICPICKEKIVGRTDKKFCSVSCKNDFHRRLHDANEKITQKIDKILHRNRKILLLILKKETQKTIPRIDLERQNFNFNYITGTYTNRKGKLYHYIYDFAWMEFSTQDILIVRNTKKLAASDD